MHCIQIFKWNVLWLSPPPLWSFCALLDFISSASSNKTSNLYLLVHVRRQLHHKTLGVHAINYFALQTHTCPQIPKHTGIIKAVAARWLPHNWLGLSRCSFLRAVLPWIRIMYIKNEGDFFLIQKSLCILYQYPSTFAHFEKQEVSTHIWLAPKTSCNLIPMKGPFCVRKFSQQAPVHAGLHDRLWLKAGERKWIGALWFLLPCDL